MTSLEENIKLPDFETVYLELRQQEGRIYSDYEVMQLPHISPAHPHHSEWLIRGRSASRLINYLKKKKKPLKILEIGCGNGWLCHQLASIEKSRVFGVDINFLELQQAARVFQDYANLFFVYTDIRKQLFKEKEFDIILFAASLQYFDSANKICQITSTMLNENGEIHILDTPFYSPREISHARQRSRNYYERMGFASMAEHYYHHTYNDIREFKPSILFNPRNFFNRFKKIKSPFPWIRLRP